MPLTQMTFFEHFWPYQLQKCLLTTLFGTKKHQKESDQQHTKVHTKPKLENKVQSTNPF